MHDPLKTLTGVGEKTAHIFTEVGVHSIADLLLYLPTQYEDRTQITPVAQITHDGIYTVRCRVAQARARKTRQRKSIIEALVSDESGSIQCVWFNQPYIQKKLELEEEFLVSGKVSQSTGRLMFNNPFVESTTKPIVGGTILPVYPLHAGLKQFTVRKMMRQALTLLPQVTEDIPPEIARAHALPTLAESLRSLHLPSTHTAITDAQERIALAQLIAWNRVLRIQEKKERQLSARCYPTDIPLIKTQIALLPFTLTDDQKKALWRIMLDIEKEAPMLRMLCGDVGSGKTVVAALASLAVIEHGDQVVLVAPTGILAEQHFDTITRVLKNQNYEIVLHTQDHPSTPQQLLSADYVIGTHAILQKTVSLRAPGLVIIDEQHRFGVNQRHHLLKKGKITPHFLSLTATPIPRSLALTLFGHLDISPLKQAPSGRKAIRTEVIDDTHRARVYTLIRERATAGEGCFIVCPLIDPSDVLTVISVEQERARVSPHLQGLRIEVLHGKLKGTEKQRLIQAFRNHEIDVLISTTVIEVGMDIPHASIMLIEDADRFGLATLHQLRGRVGRSDIQSYCFVTTSRKDSGALKRLHFFARTLSGFDLAEYDIRNRGAGDILGTEQSGVSEIVNIALRYPHLLTQAQQIAEEMGSKSSTYEKTSLFFRRFRSIHLE